MKLRVLVVDDEPRMASAIDLALTRSGYQCRTAGSGAEALAALDSETADCIVTDWRMPGMDGLELLDRVHTHTPELPVIVITAHADVPSAVQAMKRGAFDYVTKPFDNDELRAVVARALEMTELQRQNRLLRDELSAQYSADDFVAKSDAMLKVLDLAKRVAPSTAAVSIQGSSGVGKELIAKLIHYWSDRVARPFVAVNCKAFAEGVLESELFGHEKGAFTGADVSREGCFERADGGTLFLDEIAEVGLDFQAKLLRVLQESEVQRVGGSAPRKVDVRVVSATNRDLQAEIASGRFREDLFFRLNVIPIEVPPLSARAEDVAPLANHFLEKFSRRAGHRRRFGPAAMEQLQSHAWPGNVRELENAVERAVILARGETIEPEDLLLGDLPSTPSADVPSGTLQSHLDRATEERIRAALASNEGRKADAAAELGVDRTTLYRLMKRLDIVP